MQNTHGNRDVGVLINEKKVQIALIKLMNTVDLSAFSPKIKNTAIQTKNRIIIQHTHTRKVSGTHSLVTYLPLHLPITPLKSFTVQLVSYAVCLACSEGQHAILWQLNATKDYWPREQPATRQS